MFTLIEMYNEADFTNHHGFMRNVIYHNNFIEKHNVLHSHSLNYININPKRIAWGC